MANRSETDPNRAESVDKLPSALIATVMAKLDVPSICSAASTCRAFRTCAAHILSFIPSFDLLDVGLSIDLLRPLLVPPNPYLRSVKLDCTRLDDSSLKYLIRPSLQELCLHNCADFSGKLLSHIGQRCKDLRFLYLSSVAEKRGRSIDVSELEELLLGCTQLEVRFHLHEWPFLNTQPITKAENFYWRLINWANYLDKKRNLFETDELGKSQNGYAEV